MLWSDGIAIYGALLSTAVFIWNIARWLNDRLKIEVKCYEGKRIKAINKNYPQGYIELVTDNPEGFVVGATNGNIEATEQLIFVRASNASRRPATIVMWGVGYKEGGYFTASPPPEAPLPKRLEEGENYILWVSKKNFLKEIGNREKTPGYVFVKTADGKIFKEKRFPIEIA